jgi:hypothetical protein
MPLTGLHEEQHPVQHPLQQQQQQEQEKQQAVASAAAHNGSDVEVVAGTSPRAHNVALGGTMATLQEGHSFVTAPLPSSDTMNTATITTSAGGVVVGKGAPALHKLSAGATTTTTAAAAPAAAFTATPNDQHVAPSMMVWTADFFDVEVRRLLRNLGGLFVS